MLTLHHIGVEDRYPRLTANLLIDLGICEMYKDKPPKGCDLLFLCGSILQLHEAEADATGVKLAVEVNDPTSFSARLTDHGIVWSTRDDGEIDFTVGGIQFHTVHKESAPSDHNPL